MHKEELEKRTLQFSLLLIKTLKKLPRNQINFRLSDQAIKAGTSIGANYREANGGETVKDFQHKVGIVFKEAREADYWLSLLKENNPEFENELGSLLSEADELKRIFGAISSTCKRNQESRI